MGSGLKKIFRSNSKDKMEGGLRGAPRRGVKVIGGDLVTKQRQHGGIFGFIGKLLGLGPAEMRKHMSDPIKAQMLMQRGGFPWALAGLSMLPMLLGKGKADTIQNQMKTTRDPIMQRGGLSIPPALLSKGLPLLKSIGIPLAMGALASVGDNVVDKVFGDGKTRRPARAATGRSRRARVSKMRKPGKAAGKVRKTGKMRKSGKATGKMRKTDKMRRTGKKHSPLLREAKRAFRDHAQQTGRRLFERAKTKAKSKARRKVMNTLANDTPFAQKIRENISKATAPTVTSSHIGQTFNI